MDERSRGRLTAGYRAAGWATLVLGLLLVVAYSFEGLGFSESVRQLQPYQNLRRAKTLWDWLQLLGAPAAIAFGVYLLGSRQAQRESESQEQRAQNEALQAYFDQMSHLLLEKGLRTSKEDEVRTLARARTLTVLARLDPDRKVSLLQFLHETNLIEKNNAVIQLGGTSMIAHLNGADLRGMNFSFVYLGNADLSGTKMSDSHLAFSQLPDTDLREADLSNADLEHADLTSADLRYASLWDANLTGAFLSDANLEGTTLWNVNLSEADLSNANLRGTDFEGDAAETMTNSDIRDTVLTDANLAGADLRGAQISERQLEQCASLEGTIMPDGSIHG